VTELFDRALGTLSTAGNLVLLAFGAYATGIVVTAAAKRGRSRPADLERGDDPLRVAALILAHDEERVIEESVKSLLRQSHPADRLSVYVVADRCTDRTAELSREAGARVLERQDGEPGKGGAVAFGVDHISRTGEADAIIVFDADSVADREFVAAVAARLARGERAVQGLVDAKNPGASWVAASSAIGFWAIATMVQQPRERLGLSTPPMGTGFAMRTEDAVRFLVRTESLTDDLELSALLTLEGVRVAYEPGAKLLDEKPVALGTAVSQRYRWMQGRFSVAGKYVPRLLARAATSDATFLGRMRSLDAAIQLVAPSLSFTAVALATLGGLELLLGLSRPAAAPRFLPMSVVFGAAFAFYALPVASIRRFRPPALVWLCSLLSPAYLILSAPLAVSGLLGRGGRVWKRTEKG